MSNCEPCDSQEYTLPDTVYSRDIDNRVLRGIIVKTLSTITGIGLAEGGFFETLISTPEKARGITTVQNIKDHSLQVKIEVSVQHGVPIPEKAEEIQTAVVRQLTAMTGMHVSEVHVVFKDLFISPASLEAATQSHDTFQAGEFEDIIE